MRGGLRQWLLAAACCAAVVAAANAQTIYQAAVDLTNPGPIGSNTPSSGVFTSIAVTSTTPPTTNGVFLSAANILGFATGGTARATLSSTALTGAPSHAPSMRIGVNSSATTPTFVPDNADTTSGLCGATSAPAICVGNVSQFHATSTGLLIDNITTGSGGQLLCITAGGQIYKTATTC